MVLRDYILHNFWWKLLSLLLAALTWLTIETGARNEAKLRDTPVQTGAAWRTFPSIPLTLLSSATNAGRFTVNPPTVRVKVTGKQEELEKLQSQDIIAYVDVTEADDEMKFRKTIQVRAPRDFTAAADPPVASVQRSATQNNQPDEKP